mmetsp:Transcript_15294/g.36314  ORF Transcript_15294/g.36314 Transcript_15294/m.36314 type:complete len:427 (+) Transcript_15294:4013-5293(+)
MRRMSATDDVQPLLHISLVLELSAGAAAVPLHVRLEESVEIELIELTAARHDQQLLGHPISQQPHLRQCAIRVALVRMRRSEIGLGALFIGVGPVEDLFLDEFTGRQSLEGRARQVQVRPSGDRQKLIFPFGENVQVFVDAVQLTRVFELGLILGYAFVFALEQFLGRFTPGAKMVFVEHHQVPVHRVQPFVAGLDVAHRIAAQHVLERPEVDDRLVLVDLRRVAARVARQVLPAIEIDMVLQVGLPGILHRRLKRQHQHTFGVEPLCQLVGGEGLAKTHLRVPQEARCRAGILRPDRLVIGQGLAHCIRLLSPHAEGLVVRTRETLSCAQLSKHGFHVVCRATHPFQRGVLVPLVHECGAHIEVGKNGAVGSLGWFVQHDDVVLNRCRLQLLGHAHCHVARRLAHLEQALVGLVRDGVGIDARPC